MTERFVLVTGSSGGLGRAISTEIARKGKNVILHYNSNDSDAKLIQQEVKNIGTEAEIISADLSLLEGPDKLSQEIIHKGMRLSGIVNNAGLGRPGNAATVNDDDWDAVSNVNLRAPVLLVRKLLPAMDKPASVVNIASPAGIIVGASSIAYEATKAGLIHATRSMAVTLAPDIRVNAVAPGYVKTNMTRSRLSDEKFLSGILSRTPMKRLGTPEEIAKFVLFLLSEDSSFITGETILIDGGITLAFNF
jgi:3-oxoacyl-[acyl-carrier protein] reductase